MSRTLYAALAALTLMAASARADERADALIGEVLKAYKELPTMLRYTAEYAVDKEFSTHEGVVIYIHSHVNSRGRVNRDGEILPPTRTELVPMVVDPNYLGPAAKRTTRYVGRETLDGVECEVIRLRHPVPDIPLSNQAADK